jgi:hypothetical protein
MAINWKSLSDEQIEVADKIIAEANRQGVDPQLALSIGWIESNFNPNPPRAKDPTTGKVTSATGPMQLTVAAAKDTDVEDRHNVDENIRGGVTYIKQGLDKYKDPYLAALRYKEGDEVVGAYLESKDASVIPTAGIQYWDSLSQHYTATPQEETSTIRPKPDLPSQEEDIVNKSPGMLNQIAGDIFGTVSENPEASLAFLAGPASGYQQYRLNKQFADKVKANAAREATSMPTESSGDKWSRKVVGSQGPGGASVTEAASNYQTAKKLPSNLTLTRDGIVLDKLTQARLEAEEAARLKQLEAEKIAKANRFAPRARGALEKTGKWLSKAPIANVAAGLGAGVQAENLRERMREGDVPGAVISGLGTAFNTMAMIPATANPYFLGAKGLGTLGSVGMIPIEMIYEKYRQANPIKRKQAEVEVGNPTIIQKP